jgi:chitin-binding protein
MKRKVMSSALIVAATMLVSVLSADLASAHGWIISPPSRQDHCAKGRTPFDCGAVRYEPQSVEAPKGAMSCHGGSSFTILNNDGLAWPVTSIGSTTTFQWYCTACHRTLNWEYFVDGRLQATINGNQTQPAQTTSHTIGGLPSGRHKILGRWNIGDTPAAFYACVDANVGGGGGATPTTPPRATATARPRATATATARARATATSAPRATPTSGGGGTWAPGVFYSVGTTVTYGGASYRCQQAHTSQVGWEPPNVPALWQRL